MGSALRLLLTSGRKLQLLGQICTYTLSGDYSMTFSHPKGVRTVCGAVALDRDTLDAP
jgi:hypothetical protein